MEDTETMGVGDTERDNRYRGDNRDSRHGGGDIETVGMGDTETKGVGDTERDSRHREAALCNSLWLLKMKMAL